MRMLAFNIRQAALWAQVLVHVRVCCMCARVVRPLLTKAVAKVTSMATSHTRGQGPGKAMAEPVQLGPDTRGAIIEHVCIGARLVLNQCG